MFSAVRDKLVLLLIPFLRQWSFSRKPEQVETPFFPSKALA